MRVWRRDYGGVTKPSKKILLAATRNFYDTRGMPGEGKILDYIIENMDRRFNELHDRLDKVDRKIEMLLAFKWQIIGGAVAISAIVGVVIQITAAILSRS